MRKRARRCGATRLGLRLCEPEPSSAVRGPARTRRRSEWAVSGSLALASWYRIERACFSDISALSGSPTSCCGGGDRRVVGALHPVELAFFNHFEDCPSPALRATRRRSSSSTDPLIVGRDGSAHLQRGELHRCVVSSDTWSAIRSSMASSIPMRPCAAAHLFARFYARLRVFRWNAPYPQPRPVGDPRLHGLDWQATRARYRPQAGSARSCEDAAVIIKAMLAELGAS